MILNIIGASLISLSIIGFTHNLKYKTRYVEPNLEEDLKILLKENNYTELNEWRNNK